MNRAQGYTYESCDLKECHIKIMIHVNVKKYKNIYIILFWITKFTSKIVNIVYLKIF